MAKKKKSNKKQIKLNSDIKVVLLILIGIILAILIYGNSGYMGNLLNEILGGLLGIFRYIVPVIPFVSAFYMVSNNKSDLLSKIIPGIIIILCCLATMTIYQILNNALEYNITFSEIVDRAYYLGQINRGGGLARIINCISISKIIRTCCSINNYCRNCYYCSNICIWIKT